MIAADSSSLIAYFNGLTGADIDKLADAIASGVLVLPPVVISETLTDPASVAVENVILNLTILPITDGHWARAGQTRRLLVAKGFRARVADALIAQACIDNEVALITRDRDFRHFAKHSGLRLA